MTHRLYSHPRARLDEAEIFEYLAGRSLALAERFLDRLQETLGVMCSRVTPGLAVISNNQRLSGLRWSKVRDFPNHLIFFRLADGELQVVRVLHGARDIESILAE